MASLSAYYPQPVIAGTTAGTYAEGDRVAQLGAGSVVTSTGSTTARSLANRFGEVFHVDDYGAKGDWNGTTGTDDTAAIQAAINAAVAAGGGIVRFEANKKYRLNTRTGRGSDTIGHNDNSQKHFLRIGSGNLTSNFGSTSMMLYFEGNGATLHATSFETGANDIIYTCCQFHTLVFSDLKFTRNPYQITTTGNQSKALAFYPADTSEHQYVLIENCYFKDNLASIDFTIYGIDYRTVWGKLKKVDIIGCTFEYDNGSNRAGSLFTSGALCVYMCPWIDMANIDRCRADGMTNGTLSTTYQEPMHGFLFPMPIRATITNCYFTNFCVEVIKASDEETCQTGIRIAGNYSQVSEVAPNNTVSRQITVNEYSSQSLVVGKIYALFDPAIGVFDSKRGGYYRLEAKTGGGNYTFAVGESLNFTRVPSADYDLPPEHDISTFSNNNIGLIDMDLLDKCNLLVQGCTFDSKPIRNANGTIHILNGAEVFHAPDVLCGYSCQIVNNVIKGGSITIGISASQYQPTIVSNNYIYKFTELETQNEGGGYLPILVTKSNTAIKNNVCVFRESRCSFAFVRVAAHEIVITNNLATVVRPSGFGSGGVVVTALVFIDYLGGPWRVFAENNHLKDIEGYARASVDGYVGHFTGTINGTVARAAQPTSTQSWAIAASNPIRLAKQNKSPDGSTWTIGVTNDGELEVIK